MRILHAPYVVVLLGTMLIFSACRRIAFTHTAVRPILDAKCVRCHAPETSSASRWLYDVSHYRRSIRLHREAIHEETSSLQARMATFRFGNLTKDEIDILNAWYEAGSPAM